MTKLQAVNIILMYINQKPVIQAQIDTPIPIVSQVLVALDESVNIWNITTGSSNTIDTIPAQPQDYIVKRAARMAFTRIIGFDDKGLEVIIADEKASLYNVADYAFGVVFTGTTYDQIKTDIVSLLASKNTIEEVYLFADKTKAQVDDYISKGFTARFAIADISGKEDVVRRLLKTESLNYLKTKTGLDYFKNYILGLCANALTADEITDIVDSIEDDINAIVPPTYLNTEDKNRYKLSILTKDTQSIQLLEKKSSKSYLESIVGVDYFKVYILSRIEGLEQEESKDEIDSIVDAINAITTPSGLSGEDANRYKMNILSLSSIENSSSAGNQAIIEERAMLIRSIASANINSIFSDASYDYVRSNLLLLIDPSSVESIVASVTSLKSKIDNIISSIVANNSLLTGNKLLIEYAANKLVVESTIIKEKEVYYKKEVDLLTSIAIESIELARSNSIISEDEYKIIKSVPLNKQNITSVADIDKLISRAKLTLISSRKKILSYGWYGNSITITLSPNASGNIVVPKTFLSIDADGYVVRDWRLFNKNTNSFIIESPVSCDIIEDMELDDVTASIYDYIMADAIVEYHHSIVGVDNTYTLLADKLMKAKVQAMSDDASNYDGNVLDSIDITTVLDRTSL